MRHSVLAFVYARQQRALLLCNIFATFSHQPFYLIRISTGSYGLDHTLLADLGLGDNLHACAA